MDPAPPRNTMLSRGRRQRPPREWLLRLIDGPPRWWLSAWIWASAAPLLWVASVLYPLNGLSNQWGSRAFTIPVYEGEDGSLSARPPVGAGAVQVVEVAVTYDLGRTRWNTTCAVRLRDVVAPGRDPTDVRFAAADSAATLRAHAPDLDLAARDWLVSSWQEMIRSGHVRRSGYAPADRLITVYGLRAGTILAVLLLILSVVVRIARTFRMTLHEHIVLRADLRHCPRCDYDLVGCASTTCPECGCNTAARTQHSLRALETAAPIGADVTEIGALQPPPPRTPAHDARRQ